MKWIWASWLRSWHRLPSAFAPCWPSSAGSRVWKRCWIVCCVISIGLLGCAPTKVYIRGPARVVGRVLGTVELEAGSVVAVGLALEELRELERLNLEPVGQ